MEEKLKALANEMMEAFQKQGLTCREVDYVLTMMQARSGDLKRAAEDKVKFISIPF